MTARSTATTCTTRAVVPSATRAVDLARLLCGGAREGDGDEQVDRVERRVALRAGVRIELPPATRVSAPTAGARLCPHFGEERKVVEGRCSSVENFGLRMGAHETSLGRYSLAPVCNKRTKRN